MPALLTLGAVSARANTQYLTFAAGIIGGYGDVGGLQSNVLSASDNFNSNLQSGSAYADISTGSMGVQTTGNVPPNTQINDVTEAYMGDTITVAGTTGSLNLGLDLNIDGSFTGDPTQNLTFVGVYAFTPGTFDTNDFTAPGQVLFSEGFVVGSGTMPYSTYFTNYDLTYAGTYGTGTQNIPLDIPFATLGSNFQLLITLETYENADSPTANSWDVDYYHTLTASLSAPAGVTLTSASGVFPGTTAVPEPRLVFLMIGGLALLVGSKAFWRRDRQHNHR